MYRLKKIGIFIFIIIFILICGTKIVFSLAGDPEFIDNYDSTELIFYGLAVEGDYFYTSTNTDKIVVFNATDKEDISQLTTLTNATVFNQLRGMIAEDNYLYVVSNDGYLSVLDISDPNSLYIVATIYNTTLFSASGADAVIEGNILYIASRFMSAIDISTPSSPTILGAYPQPTPGNYIGIDVHEGIVFAGDNYNSNFSIFDFTTPSSPSKIYSINDNTYFNNIQDVEYSDGYVYTVSKNSDALTILDVSVPASTSIKGYYTNSTSLADPYSVKVVGDYAYCVGYSNDALISIDISDKENPTQVDYITDSAILGVQLGMEEQDGYLYLAQYCCAGQVSIYFTETIVTDTCTYGGTGDWEINLEDNCVINENYDLGTSDITFINTGTVQFNSTITAGNMGTISNNQLIKILANCILYFSGS